MFVFVNAIEDNKPEAEKQKIIVVIIVLNVIKFAMTSILCACSACFAKTLKSQVASLVKRCGSSHPEVKRLQISYDYILRFTIVFAISVLFVNLLQPTLFISIEEWSDLKDLDDYTWTKAFSMTSMTFYMVEVNVMQVLILFFHYRLD